MTDSGSSAGGHLEHLFDLELEHRPGMAPIFSLKGKTGEFLAKGEGAVLGPRITGEVRWDLYQEPGEVVCASNLRGYIHTDDGAEISFDALGYFMRPKMTEPTKWVSCAGVRFETDDPLFSWMNSTLAIWHGEFDMGANRHSYRVYARVAD